MDHNRLFWQHLTNKDIFLKYIYPEIENMIFKYAFVDFYAWEWNLILPILDFIPNEDRIKYFEEHIFLFDIQKDLIDIAIERAKFYWIPEKIAKKNIKVNDSLLEYPKINSSFPLFHITNPPYLYIWYISKNNETKHYLDYFTWNRKWLQDLYQLAMFNDIKYNIEKNIYIIPSNFLFSNSWTNQARIWYLNNYKINKAIIFEEKIFDFTGQHVWILFFEKKSFPDHESQKFIGTKINWSIKIREFELKYKNKYRWWTEFIDFCKNRTNHDIDIDFYLMEENIVKNKWNNMIIWHDINNKQKKEYFVNDEMFSKIKNNYLYIRTIDTWKNTWRIWLYDIREDFEADCIVITNWKTYRTYPIQIFLKSHKNVSLDKLKKYFNETLEHFRDKYDSDFLTTFMYSENSEYVRKFIGLTYTKQLIQTFTN